MNVEDIIRQVISFINQDFPVTIYPDSHLRSDIGLESLDTVDLIAFIEGTYNIEYRDEEIAELKDSTIEEIAKSILSKLEDNGTQNTP